MRKPVVVNGWMFGERQTEVAHDFVNGSARCERVRNEDMGKSGRPWTNADLGRSRFCAFCVDAIRVEIGLKPKES